MDYYIGVDWGSSNFRAWLFRSEGNICRVIDARAVPGGGVLGVKPGSFEQTLCDRLGDWFEQTDQVILAGMVTSRNGWIETPYLECPSHVTDLLTRSEYRDLPAMHCRFLPGLCQTAPHADVMRGEELQILGAMTGAIEETIIMPGTHSKWSMLRSGTVQQFRTWMTGEIYDLIRHKSLAGALAREAAWDPIMFLEGLEAAAAGTSWGAVFEARSRVLLGSMAPSEVGDFLSGLLIGSEVREALSCGLVAGPVTMVAAPALAERYQVALRRFGVSSVMDATEATPIGFARLITQCFAGPQDG